MRFAAGILFFLASVAAQSSSSSSFSSSSSSSAKTGKSVFPLEAVRTYDGKDNNEGGSHPVALLRTSGPYYYGDGTGEDMTQLPDYLPNPRKVSNAVMTQTTSSPNERGMSDMIWSFGQFLDHDIDLTEAGAQFGKADIPIEDPADPFYPFGPIPFSRSKFESGTLPRQQMNDITSFIDASNVYGSDEERANYLRTFEGGKLKTSKGNLLPFNEDGLPNEGTGSHLFLAGDVRVNEQIGLTSMHTLFVREHNRLAEKISMKFKDSSDEDIYQLARKLVGAELQIITYNEFLPALLGPMAPEEKDYTGWDETANAGIMTEFSTACFRVGHTMLSPEILLAEKGKVVGSISLVEAFFNPDFLTNDPLNFDRLIHGFVHGRAQEIDAKVDDAVRNMLFRNPLDLAALNIQRGRDHGLPGYNDFRESFGLPPAADFTDITSNLEIAQSLAEVYNTTDDVDLWVGAIAEDHVNGASVGETIGVCLADQFSRLRDGDRFFYLNDPDLSHKDVEKIINFKKVSMTEVIKSNTIDGKKGLPKNAFFVDKHFLRPTPGDRAPPPLTKFGFP